MLLGIGQTLMRRSTPEEATRFFVGCQACHRISCAMFERKKADGREDLFGMSSDAGQNADAGLVCQHEVPDAQRSIVRGSGDHPGVLRRDRDARNGLPSPLAYIF
jgi:hypothetical protein